MKILFFSSNQTPSTASVPGISFVALSNAIVASVIAYTSFRLTFLKSFSFRKVPFDFLPSSDIVPSNGISSFPNFLIVLKALAS